MAYVDEAFLREVAELLGEGPPSTLLDPEAVEVLAIGLDRVDHPPAVVIHYAHGDEDDVFRFELDDSWSSDDAEEAAQAVWVELADTLQSTD